MAGLKKPTKCPECTSIVFKREWCPERWVCENNHIVISRNTKPQTGICRKCGRTKDEVEFAGWGNICLECKRKYNEEYHAQNQDNIKAHHRQYYQENKKKMKDSVRKAVQRSPESFLRHLSIHIRKYSNYKKHKDHKLNSACLDVKIDYEYLLELYKKQGGLCALSGVLMTHEFNNLRTMSVDRIDSSLGYIPGNVQLVCQWINTAKKNHSNEALLKELDLYFAVRLRKLQTSNNNNE